MVEARQLGIFGVVALLVFAGSLEGCAKAKAVVEVDYVMKGTSPETLDALVGFKAEEAMLLSGVKMVQYQSVSRQGKVEVYVMGEAGIHGDALLRAVETALEKVKSNLPAGAIRYEEHVLKPGEPIPVVEPKMKPTVQVVIDGDTTARLGISVNAVDEALGRESAKKGTELTVKNLQDVLVESIDGQKVPLSKIAKFEPTMEADAVVRKWPEGGK